MSALPLIPIILALALGSLPARAEPILSRPAPTLTEAGGPETPALLKGQAALQARQYEQAEKAFADAYRADPRSPEAMIGLAAAAHAQGKAKLARDWMASAVAASPGHAPTLHAQARLLVEQGQNQAAEDSYKRAIAAYPLQPQFRLDLAGLYMEQLNKPAAAVSLLQDLLRQEPQLPAAHLGLGLALAAEGRLDESARALDQAVRLDPANPLALQALGLTALRQKRAEVALSAFDKALLLRPDLLGAQLGRGDALLVQGRGEPALAAYRQAASMAPGSVLPQLKRALALEQLKRPDEAEAAYRDALRLEAGHVLVSNNLAYLLARRKLKLDEALNLAQAVVAREPRQAAYWDTLAAVYRARGDEAAAQNALGKAAALDPARSKPAASAASPGAVADKAPSSPLPGAAPDAVVAVRSRLEAWRAAWEARDVERYLSFYASGFTPADKRPRAAWEADRRSKLARKDEIRIELDSPSFQREGEGVKVRFEQRYSAGPLRDRSRKELEWVPDGQEWKIRREIQL